MNIKRISKVSKYRNSILNAKKSKNPLKICFNLKLNYKKSSVFLDIFKIPFKKSKTFMYKACKKILSHKYKKN